MTERLHFDFSLSCIGGGNGNPLQCSCLENPRDGRAWQAAVYGVAQSQTWLKRFSSSSSPYFPSVPHIFTFPQSAAQKTQSPFLCLITSPKTHYSFVKMLYKPRSKHSFELLITKFSHVCDAHAKNKKQKTSICFSRQSFGSLIYTALSNEPRMDRRKINDFLPLSWIIKPFIWFN